MIRDALATFMEDKVFTTNTANGIIDLYGGAIPVYPSSNLRKNTARGAGSALAVDIVVKRGGTGTTAMTGTVTATLKMDDTDGDTTVIQTNLIPATNAEADALHARVLLPPFAVGRYVGLTVDDTSLVGGGDANVVDAWLGPQ